WVTDRLKILELRSRAEYVEICHEQSHDRHTIEGARTQRTDMTEQDIEVSRARAEAAEQRVETLQVSLGAAWMNVRDLIESREADMFEMAELQSRAHDIEAGFWDLERHLEIEQIVAQRATNAIETIAIYKAKTRVARDLMNRVERQNDKVAKNASNKRKWEGDHGGSSSQQQNKEHKVFSIWKAFGGNTRDLGSFGEETDKTTDLHQHFSRLCSQRLETASQDTRDAVTIHPMTVSQESMTASARTTQPKI
ncbi:hypothetical protein Tco_0681799, partial [Tanacetum coccineum]